MPYPIRQRARNREVCSLSYTTTGTQNGAINVGSVDLESWKVSFGGTPALHSDRSDLSTSYNVQAAL